MLRYESPQGSIGIDYRRSTLSGIVNPQVIIVTDICCLLVADKAHGTWTESFKGWRDCDMSRPTGEDLESLKLPLAVSYVEDEVNRQDLFLGFIASPHLQRKTGNSA